MAEFRKMHRLAVYIKEQSDNFNDNPHFTLWNTQNIRMYHPDKTECMKFLSEQLPSDEKSAEKIFGSLLEKNI